MKAILHLWYTCNIIFILLSFISCQKSERYSPNFAFSMPLGVLEGEFQSWGKNFFQYNSVAITIHNNVFFIANGNRIMKFSSNGVLLDTINDTVLNHEIGSISSLAVDSKERAIFSNILPLDVTSLYTLSSDEEKVLTQLLVYSDNGNVSRFGRLGQKNFDFSSIQNIDVLIEDTIAVLSTEKTGKYMYLFSNNGKLENQTFFSSSLYPEYPFETIRSQKKIYGIVNTVVASFNIDNLLVQVDYYTYTLDKETKAISSINFLDSLIFILDLQTGEYSDYIKLSFAPLDSLELQFVDENSRLVFFNYIFEKNINHQDTALNVLVFDMKGNLEKIISPILPDVEFIYARYNIARNGFISALLLEENKASVYWWNSDLF